MLEAILSYISIQNMLWVVVGLPLIAAFVNGFISFATIQKKFLEPKGFVSAIGIVSTLFSFIAIVIVWYVLSGLKGASPSVISGVLFSWKGFFYKPLEFGLKADQLSLAVSFVIGLTGLLIQFYSVGFLASKRKVAGYYSMFSLVYSLTQLLVLTDNFFLFFVVWQLIGLAGFVLICRRTANEKAVGYGVSYYVSEAISGAAFLLVMFLIWKAFIKFGEINLDIFQFNSIQEGAPLLLPYAHIICFALFISIFIRSLQFPLQVWLPKASVVPLPIFGFLFLISYLVVPVYILIRLNFLLVLSPKILSLIAVLGGVGSIFGSVAAIVQKDLKKILSYFAISQAGFAFVAIGVGAFYSAIFFIFVYSVYITSILLGIGSVISITGKSNIYELKGVKRFLPVTFWTILVGVLSASGIYPLAGFFSKNGVIWEAYQRGHSMLFLCCFIAMIFGTIALFRLISRVFLGKISRERSEMMKKEESSVSMLVTMVVISFVAMVVGWIGVSGAFGGEDLFRQWMEEGLATQMVNVIGEKGRFSEMVLGVLSAFVVFHTALVTSIIYVHKKSWSVRIAQRFKRTNDLIEKGFYLNRVYEIILVSPIKWISNTVFKKGLNEIMVDGVIFGSVGRIVELNSDIVKRFKVELLSGYVFWLVLGLITIIVWCMF